MAKSNDYTLLNSQVSNESFLLIGASLTIELWMEGRFYSFTSILALLKRSCRLLFLSSSVTIREPIVFNSVRLI